jgi:hypothetical protein
MAGTFPGGPGVAQPGGAGEMTIKSIHGAIVDNEPEVDGPADFPRPQPTDPGGTNTAGWVKTADYPYLDGGSGIWRQT